MKTTQQKADAIKALSILFNLKNQIESDKEFSFNSFQKENNLSHKMRTVIFDEKIIVRSGGTHRKPTYKWNTIEPNTSMSEELLRKVSHDGRGKHFSKKKKNTEQNGNPKRRNRKPNVQYGHIETKLFWGLITIKSKLTMYNK